MHSKRCIGAHFFCWRQKSDFLAELRNCSGESFISRGDISLLAAMRKISHGREKDVAQP